MSRPPDDARAKTDPELIRQLDEAADDATVEAVLGLQPAGAGQGVLPPQGTEAIVSRVIERVRETVGAGPVRVKVFRNLASFAVSAPASFVRHLLEQAEVRSARSNRRSQDVQIRPSQNEPSGGGE
ncbi:MAG TPA: hypothetical protein VF796_23460 [Humisphaera sp.]